MKLPILSLAFVVGVLWAWPSWAGEVVDYRDARDIAQHLKSIGYYNLYEHPERLQSVPRLRVGKIPKSLRRAWREDVHLRKSVFYRVVLSGILQVNEDIMRDRARLQTLPRSPDSAEDAQWLSDLAKRYGVRVTDGDQAGLRRELLLRVDALPPSLALAQAAIESGWAQSRFAREGQALFGQWTKAADGIKAEESGVRLARFDSPLDSLRGYMLNINTHPAYAGLRTDRAAMRDAGATLDGYALAQHLDDYAETGDDYVTLIRKMIDQSNLTLADTARLGQGPVIRYQRTDQ